MSDTTPTAGHNLAPIKTLANEMTHLATLWESNVARGVEHEREIMVRAYRLREFAEDPEDTEAGTMIAGLLWLAKVPQTKRSATFTQLLHLAFHTVKEEVKPEKSQISRWAGALQHAWNQTPRPAPEGVLDFITKAGGDVECAKKARQKGTSTTVAAQPIPAECISTSIFDDGKTVIPGRLEVKDGSVQFVPRNARSSQVETTPTPAEPGTA